MLLMFFIIMVGILHTLLSIVVPGIYIQNKVYKIYAKRTHHSNKNIEYILLAIGIGILFNLIEFIILFNLNKLEFVSQLKLVYVKYSIDFILLMCLLWSSKGIICTFHKSFSFFINNILLLFGVAVGVVGILNYPHILDCGQLMWTKQVIENVTNVASGYGTLGDSSGNGAIGYSSLIYFPGVLFNQIPLVTIASGFKIFISILLILSILYAITVLEFAYKNVTKITYFIIIIFSFFGQYGLIELGKDSVIAVIFSLLYVVSLSHNKRSSDYIKSAIFFSCATCLGSITVPYLFLITFIYVMVSFREIRVFLFLFWMVCLSTVGLVIQFKSMMNISSYYLLFLAIILAVICFVFRNIGFESSTKKEKTPSIMKQSVLSIIILLVILSVNYLMPIKVAIIPWLNASGQPIIEYRAPLDGVMNLYKYLFTFEPIVSNLIIWFGILGLITYPLYSRARFKTSIFSLAMFPFTMLLVVLIFGHIKSPFTGFNLWDMFRDVILWYGAIIFGLFALLFINAVAISCKNQMVGKMTFILCCLLIIVTGIKKKYDILKNLTTLAHYTQIGGNKDEYIAELTEYITLNNNIQAKFLYISENSATYFWFYSFQMYSKLPIQHVNFMRLNDVVSIKANSPVLFIGSAMDIIQLLHNDHSHHLEIKELHHFLTKDESAYLISYVDKVNNDQLYKVLLAQIEIGDGFYDNEYNKDAGIDVRWVNQVAEFSVYVPKPGVYDLNLHLINSNINQKISIYVNNKLIKQENLGLADFHKTKDINLSLDAQFIMNKVKLVSDIPARQFPNDLRNISYGILMPIKISSR